MRHARSSWQVLSEVPAYRSQGPFFDLLAAGWGGLRDEPVGPMEAVGIGFTWWTTVGEFGSVAQLPRPWHIIRFGLTERGVIHPRAHVYMLRSEVVRIAKTGEQARLIVDMER